MTPEQTVQANLDSYNQRNIDGFMSSLANDIKTFNFGDESAVLAGHAAVRAMYSDLFDNSPDLHSSILKRIVIGNKVIDHESIVGRNGLTEVLQLVLIYEVRDEKIFRISVLRE